MPDTPAQHLARHAVWSRTAQRLLAGAPAIQAAVAVNRHLDPEVLTALAASADPKTVCRMIAEQRHGTEGLRAVLARLRDRLDSDPDDWVRLDLDFPIAWALLHGDDPERVRALDAALEGLPTGTSTALVRYAAGVDRPALELATAMDRVDRTLWLTSPAAASLDDDTVWNLLLPAPSDDNIGHGHIARHLAVLFLQRPALRHPDRREDEDERMVVTAREALAVTDLDDLMDRTPPVGKLTRLQTAMRRHERHPNLPGGIRLAPFFLFQAAMRDDWDEDQRRELARMVAADISAGSGLDEDLGWLTPVLATRLGLDLRVHPAVAAQFTWEAVRRESPDIAPVHVEDPGTLAVAAIEPAQGRAAGLWLHGMLADPGDAVTAQRWQVALAAADTFAGTLRELADVAIDVCAPARP